MPRCPHCEEKVAANETECPHCGEELDFDDRPRRKSGKRKSSSGSGSMSTGTILAIIFAALFGVTLVCGGILAALLLPAVQQAREAARRTQCKNNLKQIGLAMHNYHDTFNLFPAAYLNDQKGTPRLSWRVSILPYIDQAPLYNAYSFNDAWDSPHNASLMVPLAVYRCPSAGPNTTATCYATFTGPKSALGAGKCVSIRDMSDGASNTLLVVEACQVNIPWMKPQDLDSNMFTTLGDPNGASSQHRGVVHILLADGSVRAVANGVDPSIVKSLITINGAEPVPEF